MRAFAEKTNIPFLATPMGKGVIDDKSPLAAGSARSYILQNADVIFLAGARLNWILHFGLPPRFRKDVKIIQLDNDPHEFNTNVKAEIPLFGDAKVILGQLEKSVTQQLCDTNSPWRQEIKKRCDANLKKSLALYADREIPMNYYSSMKIIEDHIQALKTDYIFVSEGSNTMDIGRTIFMNNSAKQRLDAATFGTMGVGFGFAIAAQHLFPKKKVIMVVGDSAFGFSGMEIETAVRYRLPLKCIIINNNGITSGIDEIDPESANPMDIAPTSLSPTARYDMIATAFGGKGAEIKTHDELAKTLPEMLNDNNLWILNVRIDPFAGKKS